MAEIILQPVTDDREVLVQFTESVTIAKDTKVIVPFGYFAAAYVDDQAEMFIRGGATITMCDEEDEELLNRQCKAAYIQEGPFDVLWGTENPIQVNNSRLNESYRVAARGNFFCMVADAEKLLKAFNGERVTVFDLKQKLRNLCGTVLAEGVGNYLSNSNTPSFRINMEKFAIGSSLDDMLSSDATVREMGLRIYNCTVSMLDVRE